MNLKKILTALPLGVIIFVSSVLCSSSLGNIPKVDVFNKIATFTTAPVIINGRIMVPGSEFIKLIGGKVSSYDQSEYIEFEKDNKRLSLYFGYTTGYIDGKRVALDVEPMQMGTEVMVPIRTMANLFNLNIQWYSQTSTVAIGDENTVFSPQYGSGSVSRSYKVVIDAGHGGIETGAVVRGIMEKDINLDISKRLEKLLKAQGISTFMTRTDDRYVGLYERSNFANELNADLFVSVHNNAGSGDIKGSMTLYHPNYGSTAKNGYNTYTAAKNVQNALTKKLGTRDLGLIERPHLAVLRTSNMPAILAEIGYMTNRNELSKLLTSDFKQNAAEALCDGVMATLK